MMFVQKAEDYIKEKISIENILKKLNEVDKIKFSLFNKEQLNLFNTIPNPNFNEIFSQNQNQNEEYNSMSQIDQLWRKYEFYIPNGNEENDSFKKIFEKSEKSKIDENIIELVERVYN